MVQEFIKLPTLYGYASNGKLKEWTVSVVEEGDKVHLKIVHGYRGGKKQETLKEIKSGKNLGKSNETTKFEQAQLEADSKWNAQKDKNYHEDIKSAEPLKLPMLAHSYDKRGHDLVWPAYVQPKLDGVRCIAHKTDENTIKYISRRGKEFSSLSHLDEPIHDMLNVGEMLDGELFTTQLTFQEITSAVRSEKNLSEKRHLIQYWVYDLPSSKLDFAGRNASLIQRYANVRRDSLIVPVDTYLVQDSSEVFNKHHPEFIGEGYEGTMVRNQSGKYRFNHRSPDLQKIKDFDEEEFKIIGGKEGEGRSAGQCIFECVTEEGKPFWVRCKGTDESREEQLTNLSSYIGKSLTVRFQGYSDGDISYGVPRFPVGIEVRDYE